MSKKITLECMGEDVIMEVDDDGIYFHGDWEPEDEETVLLIEGGEPSLCLIVVRALEKGTLDEMLVFAAETADFALLEALLAAGAHAKADDSAALIAACDIPHNNPDGNKIVRALVEAGADLDSSIQCALRRAVQTRDYALMRFILGKDNWVDGNAFTDALQNKDMAAFYTLLNAAETVETGHNAALHFAISMKDEKLVSDILDAGAGDTLSLENQFFSAIYYQSIPITKLLLKKDPSLIIYAQGAMVEAVRLSWQQGRPHDFICWLLEERNRRGDLLSSQRAALAEHGCVAIVDYLIDRHVPEFLRDKVR